MDDFYSYRRHLPHWRAEGAVYFVTFRLADSLPADKLATWEEHRRRWLEAHPPPHSVEDFTEYRVQFPEKIQKWLDAGHGSCLLRIPSLRVIVEDALRFHDEERYGLGDFVVMPNHVHAILRPNQAFDLQKILHTWKSYTATKINRAISRQGPLWQSESYDHIVRDGTEYGRIQEYVRENPKTAQLGQLEYTLGNGSLNFRG